MPSGFTRITTIHKLREQVMPERPAVPERPGEIYTDARRDMPWLIAKLSIGIVIIGAFRLPPVFVAVLSVLYLCIHGLSRTFARYMEHGSRRLAYPMSVCVWLLIAWQVVTLTGQGTMEVIYRLKLDEDAEYQKKVDAFPGVVAKFQAEEHARETGWRDRERQRLEREKLRQAGNEQSARRARTLLTLTRENKQVKVSGSIAAEETPAEPAEIFTPRAMPVLESGPGETAPQFLTKWAFRLKLWQLGEFGIALAGLLALLLLRISLNEKGRARLVAVQDRELLPLVTVTRETIEMLPEWREPASPSLPVVEVETAIPEPKPEIRESREEVPPCENFEPVLGNDDSLVGMFTPRPVAALWFPVGRSPKILTTMAIDLRHLRVGLTEKKPWEFVGTVRPRELALEAPILEANSLEINVGIAETNRGNENSHEIPTEGIKDLCDGKYRLNWKRKDGLMIGAVVRHAVVPEGEERDIKFVKLDKLEAILRANLDSQTEFVQELIEAKRREKVPSIQQAKAKRAGIGR